jgi:hypothetical protein
MSDEREQREHWDRSQWAEEGKAPDAPAGKTWDKSQMEVDDEGDDAGATDRVPVASEDPGGLSGGGQPSGESHWERVEDD